MSFKGGIISLSNHHCVIHTQLPTDNEIFASFRLKKDKSEYLGNGYLSSKEDTCAIRLILAEREFIISSYVRRTTQI